MIPRPCSSPSSARRGVLALGCALALGAGCREEPPAPRRPVVRYEVARRVGDTLGPSVQTYLGVVRGENETDLSFKVGGLLDQIGPEPGRLWGEGDRIAKDQVLAQLGQVDFKAERDSARARAELARSRRARGEQLLGDEAISPQEFDGLKAADDEAQAAFDRAQQAYVEATLRAPFTGRVLARLATAGETVLPGRPVLRVADLDTVSVELGVPARLVNDIPPGATIELTVAALEGRQFDGQVSEVGVAVREGSRLFKVVLKVPNPGGRLRSGMMASASFASPPHVEPNAVLLRLSALVAAAPGPDPVTGRRPLAVFVVDDTGRVAERRVKTGDFIRSSVVVTAGVEPGERVVVVGASLLHDQDLVDARLYAAERRD